MPTQSQRQLAAIMFTDIVGYTALMQQNETLARQQRDANKQIFESSLGKHQGKLLQYYGDGSLSIFNSAANAVKAAIEMQTRCRQQKVDLRIGIHSGDVMFDDTGVYGDSVNVASRIESLAVPGSVFISEKLFDEIRNQNIDARPLGFFELKNVKQPIQVFAINVEGVVVPTRDDVKGKVKQTLNSIAVLPFASLSSDPENEFFCDGITEELLNVLAKIEGLQVTSRTSSFAFKGKTEDIREIAAKLNVQKVLEGSVRKAGNKVRITAQLINAADGYHLWSETYDRSIEDIFAVQDDISREIANKFRLNLSEQAHSRELVKVSTHSMQAYRLYMKGVFLWNTQSTENLYKSLDAFKEATEADPDFADPYAYIAFIYYFIGFIGLMPAQSAADACRNAAAKAININPEHPQALLAESIIRLLYDFDWEGGKRLLEKSIALNPNNSFAHIMLASYYFIRLDKENATRHMQFARRIDPLGGFTNGFVVEMLNGDGKYKEAIEVCEEILSLEPENGYVILGHTTALGFQNGFASVIPKIEEARKLWGEFPTIMATLGMAYAIEGETEKAEEIIQWFLKAEKKEEGILMDQVAMVYGHLNRADDFFNKLEESIEKHSINIVWFYKTKMIPETISNDERFKKARMAIGLPV